MSSVATFYVFPGDRLLEFHESLAPRTREVTTKGFLFSKTVTVREDGRHAFFERAAKVVSAFEGPGYAFSFLDRLLHKRGISDMFSNSEVADLTTSHAIFDEGRAKDLIGRLAELKLTEDAVGDFAYAEAGTRDPQIISDTFRAWRQLIAWLKLVPAESVGVLSIEALPET